MNIATDLTNSQAYLADLTLDELIIHLNEMKAAGVAGDAKIRVKTYVAPTESADDRPNFPRADRIADGRVAYTHGLVDTAVLTVILDGPGE